jgi:peptidoglycan/LPS O-acetylase OafA/YrhL
MEKVVYFRGLTELRGIAAISVIFHHVELYRYRLGESSLYNISFIRPFIGGLGKNGVYLFFVLSGFLITYLLLKEIDNTKTIKIRKFYIRRILRIWPLYFIIVLLSFLIVPLTFGQSFWIMEKGYQDMIAKLEFDGNFLLHLFFLSNLALIIYSPVVGAAQSWSVSVEEQFYIFWPILVRTFYSRLPIVLTSIAIGKPILLFLTQILVVHLNLNIEVLLKFIGDLKIEYMAMGGLLAWAFVNKRDFLQKFYNSKFFFYAVVVMILIAVVVNRFPYFNALLFTFLIGFVIYNGFENKFFKKLGEVSYGIYMYHPIIMYFSFALLHHLFDNYDSYLFLISGYLLIFSLTYLLSIFSFKYIESYFLNIKSKFTIIHSKIK